jgi:hypothetical protein
MLSLEHRIYLIQCGIGFRHINTKCNKKNIKRRRVNRILLYVFNYRLFKKKLKHFFCIFFYFNIVFLCVDEDFLITEMGGSNEAKNVIPLKF